MRARDIPDSGLRLAILDALLGLGHLDEDALRDRLASIRDPNVEDPWEFENEWIAEALGRLEMVELDPEHLAQIERIDFDGGNDIYMLIEETLDIDTGGETDHYQLGSLSGIERLTALETLNLDGHGYRKAPLDLSPLRDHPSLQRVWLSGKCIHAQALEQLPALCKLDVGLGGVDDDAVLDRLQARGIEISGRR
jgi:hypothetical protein